MRAVGRWCLPQTKQWVDSACTACPQSIHIILESENSPTGRSRETSNPMGFKPRAESPRALPERMVGNRGAADPAVALGSRAPLRLHVSYTWDFEGKVSAVLVLNIGQQKVHQPPARPRPPAQWGFAAGGSQTLSCAEQTAPTFG